jgi:histidinol-phosphate phosphatase family protein
MRRAVFLDRDGVLIANRNDYVKSWAEVDVLSGTFEAMRRLAGSAYAIVVVTNQSAVGRGLVSLKRATELNDRIVAEITAHGGRIDAAYLCPHRPDDRCLCRKPAPGMFLHAARELELELDGSHVVGDAVTDLHAATNVGACGILVLTGRGGDEVQRLTHPERQRYTVAPDLSAAVTHILASQEAIA